jgi:GntR family transcriptional regulator
MRAVTHEVVSRADGTGEAAPAAGIAGRPLRRVDGLLYQQLAGILRRTIGAGELPLGGALPTEASLAVSFDVSLITVRHALRELEAEGLIRKRAAKAAIVTATRARAAPRWGLSSFADIAAATEGGRLAITSWRKERSARAREVFGAGPARSFPCLRGVLSVRGLAVSQVTIWFPPAIGDRLARADFDDVVVFRSVERRLGIVYAGATATVRAELADAPLAKDLDYVEGGPVLTVEFVYRTADGAPVELTVARHRADRYSIATELPAARP